MEKESPTPVLISVKGMTKSHGEVKALERVDFDLLEGEVLGIIGPNGAGKTTLLECLAGLLPCDAGEVSWRGFPLPPSHRKQAMFYLPDGIVPYAEQAVWSVLDFFCRAYGIPFSDRDRVVHDLSLAGVLEKRVGALSKGYRKRMLLALGLLSPQPLLVMDEPFDGFDVRQTQAIMSLLRPLTRHRTLLLSIHQLQDAERICDRFVFLCEGQVRGFGSLEELWRRTGKPQSTLEEVFLALT